MCSMPSCLSARPTWVRRGLSPAPPGLGGWGLVHRLAGLGGVEVVAAAVGVEGAEQALPRDGLLQPDETRGGPLLLDQDGREDRAGGVVHRDDQVECRALRQPSVLRAVLEHQYAWQRPARPLLAVGRALRCLCDQAALLQHALGPRVAADKQLAVRHGPALDRFVEVLGREIEVAGAELLNHPRNLVDRCPPARGPPAPAVPYPLFPVRLIGVAQPAKVPLAHPQQLRRLHAAQLPRLMQPNRIDDPGHSDLRQHAIPPAQTGQIVCYETRTYLVSPTGVRRRQ